MTSPIFLRGFTEAERRKIDAAAKAAGLTVSDWARGILLRAVGGDGTPRSFTRKLSDAQRAAIRDAAGLGVAQIDLAKKYKVSQAQISRIVGGSRGKR
jgi:hypothetical protein